MKISKNLLLSLLFIFAALTQSNAQASLAAENQINDIPVTLKSGKKKVYTVFRDSKMKNQWYYLPNELRVAEDIGPAGKPKPKLTVLRYQYQGSDKVNKEGGVVVATFTYAIEPEAVDQVKKAIIDKTKDNTTLISAMPFSKAEIDFLLGGSDFVVKGDSTKKNSNAGPTSASQEITKAFEVTALGTGIFQGLVRSAGLPFATYVTYNGLTPPCGYTVTGNWDNVYKYYEKISKVEGKWSVGIPGVFGFGGGADRSSKKVDESLKEKSFVDTQIIPCNDEKTQAVMDAKALDIEASILSQISGKNITTMASELAALQSMIDKTTDESAKGKLMKLFDTKYGEAQLGVQVGIQDIKKRKSGTIKLNNNRQQLVSRSTVISGGISISKYYSGKVTEQQLINDGILVDIDANAAFPSVIISLPAVNPELGLRALAVEVGYKTSDGKTLTEARTWDPTKGWTTPTGVKAEFIRFNLLGEKNVKRRQEPPMHVKMVATSSVPNASFTIEKDHTLSIGERNLDPMELLTKQIVVDGSILDYKVLTQNPDDLAYAKVQFTHGTNLISKDVKPQYVNGSPSPPNTVYFLLPRDEKPITNSVIYFKSNGAKVEKPNSLTVGENTLLNEWKTGV